MESILFYDGRCPLCAREIALLDKWKKPGLILQDIHTASEAQIPPARKTEFLSILHLRDQHGEWQKGLDATVKAWSFTPFSWLFKPLRWPGIKTITDRLYQKWATQRACKLGYTHTPS